MALYWTKKGNKIGFLLGSHPDYLIAYYAAINLGIIVIPINPLFTVREMREIQENVQLKYLVIQNESANIMSVLSATAIPRIYVGDENKEIKLTLPFEYLDDLIHTPLQEVGK
ncbi:AMP-binding protein [Peribacillus sp. NPDC060186]